MDSFKKYIRITLLMVLLLSAEVAKMNDESVASEELKLRFINIFGLFSLHFLITFPSFLKDGSTSLFNRLLKKELPNPDINVDNIIVLIHGKNSNPRQFLNMCNYLSKYLKENNLNNFTPFGVHLPNGSESVINDAKSVYEQLYQKFGSIKKRNVYIIGVSKGGVTACYTATIQDPVFIISKVMTVSSPLKGTLVAKYASCETTQKELSYNNSFLIQLENSINEMCKNKNLKIYHVVPKWDHLIIPTSSSRYSNTPNENIINYNGYANHIGIQNNVNVISQIIKLLFNN